MTEWSPIRSVILRVINKIGRSDLSIMSMITDRIQCQQVLLPINHNCYNFRKQQIHLGQISLVEAMSKVKNMSPFWKFLIFFG